MKKSVSVAVLCGLLIGCSVHRQIRCQMRAVRTDGRVVTTPWHKGMDNCLAGAMMLPDVQAKVSGRVFFVVRGNKKQKAKFIERLRHLNGQQPATVPMEVKNRG